MPGTMLPRLTQLPRWTPVWVSGELLHTGKRPHSLQHPRLSPAPTARAATNCRPMSGLRSCWPASRRRAGPRRARARGARGAARRSPGLGSLEARGAARQAALQLASLGASVVKFGLAVTAAGARGVRAVRRAPVRHRQVAAVAVAARQQVGLAVALLCARAPHGMLAMTTQRTAHPRAPYEALAARRILQRAPVHSSPQREGGLPQRG